MQNPHFMKSRYEIIAMITTWCDDGRVYENEICDRRFDFNPPKIISFGYIENNMSVIMDHPTKQQKKTNNIKLLLSFFLSRGPLNQMQILFKIPCHKNGFFCGKFICSVFSKTQTEMQKID